MAATIEVKYFNTFWVKKTNSTAYNQSTSANILNYPNFTGLPFKRWRPDLSPQEFDLNYFSVTSTTNTLAQSDIAITEADLDWLIEESRIEGKFNGNSTDYGVKAYIVDKNYFPEVKLNKVIYSGLFNSDTNVNETNVFSMATNITFTCPPEFGSIQKLYASDTKLHYFQENKISRSPLDKDMIYAANGQGTPVSTTTMVIGDIVPYAGEYGISTNPESFDYYGTKMYFTDKRRNAVLRLAENGLIPISEYGMTDFFRDEFSLLNESYEVDDVDESLAGYSSTFPPPFFLPATGIYLILQPTSEPFNIPFGSLVLINGVETGVYVESVINEVDSRYVYISDFIPFEIDPSEQNIVTFRNYNKDLVIGSYDVYNSNYVVSIQTNGTYNTLSYDEDSKGWVSFFDYRPSFMYSLFSNFYTTTGNSIWRHYSENVQRNSFYGSSPYDSTIEFIFNDQPSVVKVFKTVNYEGTNGWEVEKMESDRTGIIQGNNEFDSIDTIRSYDEGFYVEGGVPRRAGFYLKENRYCANVVNNSQPAVGEVILGNQASGIKGYFTTVKMRTDSTTDAGGTKELFMVGSEYVPSSY